MANLFLVERGTQVQDLIDRGMREEGHWMALGPSAMWALEQQGIAYQIPEDYYRVPELESLCRQVHEKVEGLCRRLDEFLSTQSPELQKWGMRPFLFYISPLIMLFDGLVSRIFQLRAILNAYPDSRVWAHVDEHYPWGAYDICFSYDETLWGQLLLLPGWDRNVELLKQPRNVLSFHYQDRASNRVSLPQRWVRQRLGDFAARRLVLRSLVSNFGLRGGKGLWNLTGQRARGSLLVSNAAYEWASVFPVIEDKGWRIFFINDRFFQIKSAVDGDRKTVEWEKLVLHDPQMADCFQCQGISFYPLLQDRFAWVLATAPGDSKRIMAQMSQLIKKHRIKAVLTGTSATFASHAISQAARYLGLPVIQWQHGFVGGRNGNIQLNEYNDLMTASVLFTYGDGVSAAFRPFIGKFPSEVVSIGAVSFDRIREKEEVAPRRNSSPLLTRRILYATTAYYGTMWYYGFSPPFNDRILYQEQRAIVRYLQSLVSRYGSRFSVTVKLAPGLSPEDPPWVTELTNQAQIRVIKQTPTFTRLLEENDVIIIDVPTTTVLQAAATRKPLFVLTGIIGYPEPARVALGSRAVCSDHATELMKKLEQFLEKGIYEADVENCDFLKSYGIHRDDGRGLERAVNEVLKVVGRG